jgi:predicted O-methyltransferase YrrM
MLISILALVLALTNIITYRKLIKYKKRSELKFKLPQVSASFLGERFKINKFGPTFDAEISFIGRGDLNVPGGTSDTESWILSVLAKSAKQMFEFGTCTGKTTYLWARNSSTNAKITTLTLSPEEEAKYLHTSEDTKVAKDNAINESQFTSFLYSNTPFENKVEQLFMDSKKLDESKYLGKCDLIFIDGSHAYSYVKSDTEKAFKMLAPGGMILWHDYNGAYKNNDDVCKYLEELSKEKSLYHVKETTLVVYKN